MDWFSILLISSCSTYNKMNTICAFFHIQRISTPTHVPSIEVALTSRRSQRLFYLPDQCFCGSDPLGLKSMINGTYDECCDEITIWLNTGMVFIEKISLHHDLMLVLFQMNLKSFSKN